MVDMVNKQILPSCMEYNKEVCDMVLAKKNVGIDSTVETQLANRLSCLVASLDEQVKELEGKLCDVSNHEESVFTLSRYYRDEVFASMQSLRAVADELETIVSEKAWPFPTYSKLLFNV
jgi:glutamine synthetase